MTTSESDETQQKTIATNEITKIEQITRNSFPYTYHYHSYTRGFTNQVKTMGFKSKHGPRQPWVGINTLILSINALILISERIRNNRQDVRDRYDRQDVKEMFVFNNLMRLLYVFVLVCYVRPMDEGKSEVRNGFGNILLLKDIKLINFIYFLNLFVCLFFIF